MLDINARYFNWLYNMVTSGLFAEEISYRKLFDLLHKIDFKWTIPMDENRASDGLDLRYRFDRRYGISECDYAMSKSDKPCSVLEMIIALSVRCEECVMDDPKFGDRTTQWFWGMISNLGLNGMTDNNFDSETVSDVINRFLDRQYEKNGKGGLFTIRGCHKDLRYVEIWYQLNWYINSLIG